MPSKGSPWHEHPPKVYVERFSQKVVSNLLFAPSLFTGRYRIQDTYLLFNYFGEGLDLEFGTGI